LPRRLKPGLEGREVREKPSGGRSGAGPVGRRRPDLASPRPPRIGRRSGSGQGCQPESRGRSPRLGRSRMGRPRIGRSPGGRPRVGPAGVGRARIERSGMERSSVGRSRIRRPRIGRSPVGRSRVGPPRTGRPRIGRSPVGRPRTGRPRIGRSPVGRSRIGRRVGRSRVGRSPIGRSVPIRAAWRWTRSKRDRRFAPAGKGRGRADDARRRCTSSAESSRHIPRSIGPRRTGP